MEEASRTPRSLRPASDLSKLSALVTQTFSVALSVIGLVSGLGGQGLAQSLTLLPNIQTAAGTGAPGDTTTGGPANAAAIKNPGQAGFDATGNVYFGDAGNYIYKIDRLGTLSIVAGTGTACSASTAPCGDGGAATSAQVNIPYSIAVDRAGNIFIADYRDNRIREIVAATGTITTLVGTGTAGTLNSTTPVPGTAATISHPIGLAIDNNDNVFFSDSANNVIYKYFATGANAGDVAVFVNTSHSAGYSPDGTAAGSALINQAIGMASDSANNLYIADQGNNRIRMVSATTGNISTVVGNGTAGYTGDGGTAIAAELNGPRFVTFDNAGDLIIADSANDVVRIVYAVNGVISTGSTIETFAGTGANCSSRTAACGDGGLAIQAQFGSNSAAGGGSTLVAYNPTAGNTYISDFKDNRLRSLTPSSSFAPTAVAGSLTQAVGLQVLGGPLTISSVSISPGAGGASEFSLGTVTGCTVDGTTSNSIGTICSLPVTFSPAYPGLRTASIKVVTSNGTFTFGANGVGQAGLGVLASARISDLAGTGTAGYTASGPATSAQIASPRHEALDNQGNLYFADATNHVIRKVAASSGSISTIAGTAGSACSSSTAACGDGGAAISANLNAPEGVAIDSAGNLYIADTGDNRVRKLALDGSISTIAGTGAIGYTGDAGPATLATLSAPTDLVIDANGLLYIADSGNHVIRSIAAGSLSIYTAAGTGTACSSPTAACGDGASALLANLNDPEGVALDPHNNLVIADTGDNRIRLVDGVTGFISTAIGTGSASYSGDGAAAMSATLYAPSSVAVDPAGDYYVADSGNHALRQTTAATGTIVTLAGSGSACTAPTACGNGSAARAATLANPGGVALDGAGNVYIADTGDHEIRQIRTSVAALAFATTPVGSTSSDSPQNATLANIGNEPLSFPPPSSGANPTLSAGFAEASADTCPQLTSASAAVSLAAGASCTFAVNFSPSTAGSYSGSLVATDSSLNRPAGTQTLALIATATRAAAQAMLTVSPGSSSEGQSVTLTATITGPAVEPTGTVTFYNGSGVDGTAAVNSAGVATLTIASLPAGTDSLNAIYGGDANYTGASSNTVTLSVSKAAGADTLTASNVSPTFGSGITLSDTIPQAGSIAPTGTVTFYSGSTGIGTGTVNSSGVATLQVSSLPVGANSVTAAYSGDGNYAPVTSNAVTVTVGKANGADSLTVSSASPMFGASVSLTDTIPTVNSTPPTGTVTFYSGATAVGTAAVSASGTATVAVSNLPVGSQNLTAAYSGDANYANVTSNTVAMAVGKAAAADTLTSSNASLSFGDQVSLTVSLPIVNGVAPTGTVTFFNGSTAIGTLRAAATVTLTLANLSVGTDSITAIYSGDSTYARTTSNVVAETVAKAGSAGSDTLASSSSTQVVGNAVTFTDTVAEVGGTPPTGSVVFSIGSTVLGTAPLDAFGTATLTVSSLSLGTVKVSAAYSGDSNYNAATSNFVVQTIVNPDFSIAATPVSQSVDPGGKANYTLSLSGVIAAFNSPVVLSAKGLPAGAVASFTPSTLTPGIGPATTVMTITTTTSQAKSGALDRSGLRYAWLLLPVLGVMRMRRKLTSLPLAASVFILVGAAATLTGCSGGYFARAPQTCTIVVTGTSGSLAHSASIELTIR